MKSPGPLLLVAVAHCLFLGCDHAEEHVTKSHEGSTKVSLARSLRPGKEQVALLSAKYVVPAADVESILVTYLTEHDLLFRGPSQSQTPSGSNDFSIADAFVVNADGIPITLSNLSARYQLSTEKLASLVIDFGLMRRAYH
jgi:hypothetical protein